MVECCRSQISMRPSPVTEAKTVAFVGDHAMSCTGPVCPAYVSRYCSLYEHEQRWIAPSSVPARYIVESPSGKSNERPDAWREMTPSCVPTRLSTMSGLNVRPFFIDHSITRPSVEIETRLSPRSGPLSTQRTCHTGSMCLPALWPESSIGVLKSRSLRVL